MNRRKFLDTASEFRSRGWQPICIHQPSKYPQNFAWQKFSGRALTTRDIYEMADQYDDNTRGIGILTGAYSNLIVLDIDGEEGFAELEKSGIKLPDTVTVTTGRGKHYYFKYISDPAITNRARYLNKVDIRTDGGLVVAPPTVHPSNSNGYKWVTKDCEVAEFPEDLLNLLKEVVKKPTTNKSTDKGTKISTKAVEGSRNDTLFRAGCAMQSIGFDEDVIRKAIKLQNDALREPLSDAELEKTVFSSIFKYETSTEIRGLSDYDNALRMIDIYKDQIIYVPERKKWFYYKDGYWTDNKAIGVVTERFVAMTRTIPSEVEEPSDGDPGSMKAYEQRLAFANSCRNESRITKGLNLTKALLNRSELEFDIDEWLLCVKNGTLNLKERTLQPHSPTNYIMRVSPVKYDPSASAPMWDKYLDDVLGVEEGNAIRKYIQKAVGYTLTGRNNEKAFFILYGESDSGKSVFLNTIGYILGDFYKKASFSTFTTRGQNQNVRNDLANLRGTRLVVASESNEGDRFDESLIKDITGGEPINCRFLYGEDFNYRPDFKMWFSTNHLPTIRDDSNAMWNRVKVLPFTNVIPPDKQDKNLSDKIAEQESSGVLNWCLKGLAMYLEEGLEAPKGMLEQVDEYREQNDVFGSFISDCCVVNPASKIDRVELFAEFDLWRERTKCYPKGMTNRTFYSKLKDRGFGTSKSGNTRYINGIQLRSSVPEKVIKKDGNVTYLTKHNGEF